MVLIIKTHVRKNKKKLSLRFNFFKNFIESLTFTPKKLSAIWKNLHPKKSEIKLSIFFKQLNTLLSAGIALTQSLEIIYKSNEKNKINDVLLVLKKEVESGKSFSESLRTFPIIFPPFVYHLVYVGEYSGTLDRIMEMLVEYYENQLILKNQIKQALFYPTIVLSLTLMITLFMLIYIVPKFEELFQTIQGTLPSFTLFILHVSNFLRSHFLMFILSISTIIIYCGYFHKKAYSESLNFLCFKIPYLKTLIKKVIFIRFSKTLAITLKAGIPLAEALKIIAPIMSNQVYSNAILKLHKQVFEGNSLYICMERELLFLPLSIQMIKIGEESGSLDDMLGKVAELYQQEFSHFIKNLNHLLEPLIMVILGVLIGSLIIAMYLPIFKLGTVI